MSFSKERKIFEEVGMRTQLKTWVFATFLAAIMIGCGGGGGGGTKETAATTINGVASKGPISGGTVTVYALNTDGSKGNQLGTAISGTDGSYSISLGTYTGNVLVEVTGGAYKDEATGATSSNTLTLRAALTSVSGSVSVAVSPLTEIAVQYASTLTKENIEKANSLVGSMAGLNIINTLPVDVTDATASSKGTVDQINYGLILSAISQMIADGNASSVSDAISKIKNDLSDDNQLDDTGDSLLSALTNFIANPNNQSGVTTLDQTNLDDAINYITNNPITPPSNVSDLTKAKALVSDLRNTALSIYNYQGVGTAGVFNGLAEELETKIKPELTYTVERIGWILEVASWKASGNYYNYETGDNLSITFTSAANDLDYSSASFTVKDPQGNTIDSGSLTVQANGDGRITSGSFTATMKTASGNLSANLSYTGTVNNGSYTSMTFTGSMAAPGLSLDFSQSGRKLHATFAPEPGSTDPTAIYPTSILASARITTTTAQMDGNLNISSIEWANKGYMDEDYSGNPVCVGQWRPKTATFTGSFEELSNGATTGVKFSGTITGSYTNAATYDGCTDSSTANFDQWNASFDGKVEAPSRPTITAFLKATKGEYRKITLDANYRRTNTDGTVIYLSGSGAVTVLEYPNLSGDTYLVTTATLTNQDGIKVNISNDESKYEDQRFTGTITTSGGEKMANLYTIEGAPMVKYVDNYLESIF